MNGRVFALELAAAGAGAALVVAGATSFVGVLFSFDGEVPLDGEGPLDGEVPLDGEGPLVGEGVVLGFGAGAVWL